MKIIIIAAGWATRLGKETIDIPKGLLKITKKSIDISNSLEITRKSSKPTQIHYKSLGNHRNNKKSSMSDKKWSL